MHSLLAITFLFFGYKSTSQNCPPNIDFERGNFNIWTCYTGTVSAASGQNVITLSPFGGPAVTQHTMYSSIFNSNEFDPYGLFPVNCPNGSGHSIRLGNNTGGGQAEGISYEFTIPAGRNVYSLIYHYAVVFQDPNHQIFQQPRMEVEITNVTDSVKLDCSSFTFIPYGNILPGFFRSTTATDTVPVWCKDWSAVSINLNGNAGKKIQLFFKTADCTFTRHFGYAYIDVNSECNSEFVGATFCKDDQTVNVTAPFGYESYNWYNNNFSQILGDRQTISFTPPPAVGTTIAVQVIPYNGYGCIDTLFAKLVDTLTVHANAGRDSFICNNNPVQLGEIPKPGLIYNWSPSIGLSKPDIANPLAIPGATTAYILTAKHDGGGCVSKDTVIIEALITDTSIRVLGKDKYCVTSEDNAILVVQPEDSIQWFKDDLAIAGAHQTHYQVNQSGSYYALLYSKFNCSVATAKKQIVIETPKPGIRYPLLFAIENYPLQLQSRSFAVNALWSPNVWLDKPDKFNPVFKGISEQQYTIALTSLAGCLTVDTQLVRTIKEVKIYVPTAFTPNNDGLNDYLRPIPAGIKEFKYFRIYNRWGQLMFDLKNDERGWDGTIKGSMQTTQVVVWMAEGIGVDNRVYRQRGTATLIR